MSGPDGVSVRPIAAGSDSHVTGAPCRAPGCSELGPDVKVSGGSIGGVGQ